MGIYDIFSLLGGIGLFLFGMHMMSDGLERAAGSKMRSILETLTKNRLIGTLVGLVITAIIQSSSAVTATVVSFVNAGMMDLTQSVGVIFGANIGTSVTGQLMAFSFEKVAPLIIAISMVCYLFIKNDMVKKIAYVILGFGILFLGMGMMKDSMSTLAESPSVVSAIQSASNPFLLMFIGLVITAVIQSNSAMTGILIGMAASGLITVEMSFYVILGSNIGACVTALLASVNGNRNSKRAALIHLFFNIIGTAVIFILLCFFQDPIEEFIRMLSPGNDAAEVLTREVAMANTLFRVFNVLIMFPFANGLVKLTRLVLPVKDHSQELDDMGKLKYIGDHTIATSSTALFETSKEIERVGSLAVKNMELAYSMFKNKDKKIMADIARNEKNIDALCQGIQNFMVKVTQMQLSNDDEARVAGYFHTIIDIERIGDHAENLAEFAVKCIDEKIEFSGDAWKELDELFELVDRNVKDSIDIFKSGELSRLPSFAEVEDKIDNLEDYSQSMHIKRMSNGSCSPKCGIYTDILSNLERVGDHANNIAFSAVPEDMFMNLKTGELYRKI